MDAKQAVRRQFGPAAARYARSGVHSSGPNLDAMIRAASLAGEERVLDLGCGPGHTALAFAPRVRSVVGLDLSPEMLDAGRKLAAERHIANVEFQHGDVEQLPFPAASFDLVTSRLSAHHYPHPERALAEAARVLRPTGALLLVDSVAPEDDEQDAFLDEIERLRDPSHVRNWRVSEWSRMFAAAGFRPETHGSWTLDLDFPDWVARMDTPADRVAALHAAMEGASERVREHYRVRPAGDWDIPIALLRGVLA